MWGQTSAGPTFVKIDKVRHKYVARFQDINPNDLPSEQPTLELFQATQGEIPEALLERLAASTEVGDEVFNGYSASRVWPLHTVALLLNTSLADVRLRLRRRAGRLKAFDGAAIYAWDQGIVGPRPVYLSIDEARRRRVAGAERVIIDDSALLTLAELDLFPLLEQCFNEVIVPQTVVNALDTEIARVAGLLTPSALPVDLGIVDRARRWAREHATLVPSYTRLLAPTERLARYGEVLPHDVIDALLAAEELGVPLFTDDAGLGGLVVADWRVGTTNTRHLLDRALDRGRITLAEQAKGLAQLISLGYTFTTFNALHLAALFNREGVSLSFKGLVAGLGERETSRSSPYGSCLGSGARAAAAPLSRIPTPRTSRANGLRT